MGAKRAPKVLLIDDNPAITRLLSSVLLLEGLRVVVSNDAGAGVALAIREKPDLVILDVCMPELDGWEVCRRIRQEGRSMPILVLTVLHEAQDIERTFQSGANAHMTKPFSVKELLERVHGLLAQKPRKQRRTASARRKAGT